MKIMTIHEIKDLFEKEIAEWHDDNIVKFELFDCGGVESGRIMIGADQWWTITTTFYTDELDVIRLARLAHKTVYLINTNLVRNGVQKK